jgi:hypothetical protein
MAPGYSKVLFKESGRAFGTSTATSCMSGCGSSVTFDFASSATKVYGMGQNRQDQNGPGLGVNVLGNTYDFQKSIGYEGGPSNSLPWAMGADPAAGGFQWGLLFNSPALGGVTYGTGNMTWSIVEESSTPGVGAQVILI